MPTLLHTVADGEMEEVRDVGIVLEGDRAVVVGVCSVVTFELVVEVRCVVVGDEETLGAREDAEERPELDVRMMNETWEF